jgi:hypothetical protein
MYSRGINNSFCITCGGCLSFVNVVEMEMKKEMGEEKEVYLCVLHWKHGENRVVYQMLISTGWNQLV